MIATGAAHSDTSRRPLRVLHVYSGNMYGGIETILSTLAQHRDLAPGMEPSFAVCFAGRLRDELLAAGCTVHDLGAARISRPWTIWRVRRRLAKLLLQQTYDLVVTHACWPHAIFGAIAKRYCPVVFWGHDINAGRHYIERWSACHVPSGYIANSKVTQLSIQQHLFPQAAGEVVYCPIALSNPPEMADRRQLRHNLGIADDTAIILQVGRLERYKGYQLHLQALSKLPRDLPWQAWIVGGTQRPAEAAFLQDLTNYVAEQGLTNRVRFLGQRSDVPQLMRAADIFCQPNERAEPFGIVFIEALAAGLPVVTTNLGGGAEIVTPHCGVLTAPGDVQELTAALTGLLTNPTLRHTLGSSGPRRAALMCEVSQQLPKLESTLRSHCQISKERPRHV